VGTALSDPVRDTREAVDAARRDLLDEWTTDCGYRISNAAEIDAFESAVEAWVLARERRETFARGDDATEARP
jgi:hypothetical protein